MSWLLISDNQNTGASASASVLPMSIQGWFSLRLTGLISFLRDSQESSPTPQFEGIYSLVLCLLYGPALTSVHDVLSSVQFSHSVVSDSLQPQESQHARPPCPSPTPGLGTGKKAWLCVFLSMRKCCLCSLSSARHMSIFISLLGNKVFYFSTAGWGTWGIHPSSFTLWTMTISLVFLNLLSFKLEFLLKTKGIPVNNVETKKQTKQNKKDN